MIKPRPELIFLSSNQPLGAFDRWPSPRPQDGVFEARMAVVYCGPSMNPTLREGDLLEVEPYKARLARTGDVIAYLPANGDTPIVHRVTRVRADGIHTRGDHNDSEDPRRLRPTEIAGQVVAAWRGQKRLEVLGGPAGAALGTLARVLAALDRWISPILRRPYHALARSSALRQILPPGWRPRLVGYQVDGRIRYHLLLGGRLVGRYDHDLGAWRIKRPFKLLVDERSLPGAGYRDQEVQVTGKTRT